MALCPTGLCHIPSFLQGAPWLLNQRYLQQDLPEELPASVSQLDNEMRKIILIIHAICLAQSKNRYDSGVVLAKSRNPTLSADSGIVPDNSRIGQGVYQTFSKKVPVSVPNFFFVTLNVF